MSRNFKIILLQRIDFIRIQAALELSSAQHCVFLEKILILEMGFIMMLEIFGRLEKRVFL